MNTNPVPKRSNGAGTAALSLAVSAVVIAATVWGIPLAVPLGLAAAVCGGIGWRKARRGAEGRVRAIVGLVLGGTTAAVCLGVSVWFIHGLSHAYDRPGELVSQGGVYETPLSPGATARYRDGVRVTVGKARRVPNLPGDVALGKGEVTYEFTVTYVNDRKSPLALAGNGIRTEEKIMPGALLPSGPMSPEWDRDHPWFPKELGPHEKVAVKMHVNAPPGSTALDFTCSPTDYRDDAHWLLPLR